MDERRKALRGTTVVELMVVMTIMVVAVTIFYRMVVATGQLREVNRENSIAAEAARVVLEEIHNQPFGQVFRLYNAEPNDDPGGVGTAPGHRFAVRGLDPLASSPDGLVGEVFLPVLEADSDYIEPADSLDNTLYNIEDSFTSTSIQVQQQQVFGLKAGGNAWELREDCVDPSLGMPRDLNGDSMIDGADHARDYIVLPIKIRIEWDGRVGSRSFEVYSILTEVRYE